MQKNENLIFLLGPTNTGKTYYAIQKMLTFSNGIIGLPLRLLAREVYEKVVKKVGRLKVALITGEEQISPVTARYYVTTVEAMPNDKNFDFLAVDEIQLCNDFERGHIFTDRLLNSRGSLETLFLGSDSMEKILKSIFQNPVILNKKRRSKLSYIGKKGLLSLPKRSAIIAFNFNDVYSIASKLKAIKGGAAIVMGSLSPQTRNSQVSIFEEGTVDYIVATDAIGMGLNLNIKNVSFSTLKKFDGKESRILKNNEIGQIAGRAGRDTINGNFSTTLESINLSSDIIKAVENHNYSSIGFLYWRESNLDFSSLTNLVLCLEKKSNDPRLVKTQYNRDENTLKYLSSLNMIRARLNDQSNVKLLWDISTIPDYFKNLDSVFTDLLVRIYCNIVDTGFLNTSWAISETKKLQNLEGTIDMITFRLAKTRFWNYISNRSHWTNQNKELKELALETEKFLSDALHKRLTNEFVDKKIRQFLSAYNLKKSLDISINQNNKILLNNISIGSIQGFQVKIDDENSIFKNKLLKEELSNKVKIILEKFTSKIINTKNLNLTINADAEILLSMNKIGSLYKGESLLKPKIIIKNNQYLSEKTYFLILEKLNFEIKKKLDSIFWNQINYKNIKSQTIKAFLFSIEKNFGILQYENFEKGFLFKNQEEKRELEKKDIFFGKTHAIFKKLLRKTDMQTRWVIGSLYINGKVSKKFSNKKILYNATSYSKYLLHLVGYVKIKNIGIELLLLESLFTEIFNKRRRVFYFDNNILSKFNISYFLLDEILIFFGFVKLTGTPNLSYWKLKRKNYEKKKNYDINSPFYVLKKLQ